MAAHVLCVRHGLSTWNLERRWQGRADPPLSDEGRAGALELAAALATAVGTGPRVRLWSSNLQRARETATIIAAHLGAAPVTVDPRLVEADIGEWQGLTAAVIEETWPGYLEQGRRPPGFEDPAALLARVVPALEDIAATATRAGVVAIVVAHAGVLRAVRRHSGAGDEHLANLAGLWFAVEPGAIRFTGLFEPPRTALADADERL